MINFQILIINEMTQKTARAELSCYIVVIVITKMVPQVHTLNIFSTISEVISLYCHTYSIKFYDFLKNET